MPRQRINAPAIFSQPSPIIPSAKTMSSRTSLHCRRQTMTLKSARSIGTVTVPGLHTYLLSSLDSGYSTAHFLTRVSGKYSCGRSRSFSLPWCVYVLIVGTHALTNRYVVTNITDVVYILVLLYSPVIDEYVPLHAFLMLVLYHQHLCRCRHSLSVRVHNIHHRVWL